MINTRIYPDPEGKIIINPFYGSDLEVRLTIEKIKNKAKPFPHDMQTNNKKLLQEKYYHSFDGEAAIYVKNEEYIAFSHKLFKDYQESLVKHKKNKQPFFNTGAFLVQIGYDIMNCNPHFTEKQLYDCLYHIFYNYVQIPTYLYNLTTDVIRRGNKAFTDENTERVVNAAKQVFEEPFKGKIQRKNQIIYNPDYDLTPEEIIIVRNELLGKKRSDERLNQIYETYINWNPEDGKPTQKNIAKKLEVHVNTIKNYWKEVKELIEINDVIGIAV